MSCAALLFGEKGYHNTSITDIVLSANTARGTFYLYFKNKRSIFEELVDSLVNDIRNTIYTVDVENLEFTVREQLLDNISRVLNLLTSQKPLLSILLKGAVGLDTGFDAKLAEFYNQIEDVIVSSLELGKKMNLVRPLGFKIVARASIGAMKENLHSLLEDDVKEADVDEVAATVLDIFSSGILQKGTTIP